MRGRQMNKHSNRTGVFKLRLLAGAAAFPLMLLSSIASAQTVTLDPPPVRAPLDENGVDLASGRFTPPSSSIKIGDDASGMVHSRYRVANGWRHNYILTVVEASNKATVSVAGASWTFTASGANWTSDQKMGDTLVETAAGYTFTTSAGTVFFFSKSMTLGGGYYGNVSAIGSTITEPDGKVTTLVYKGDSYTKWIKNGTIEVTIPVVRLQSVNANTGFQLKFAYAGNSVDEATADNWMRIVKVTAINNAVEYCDPNADSCSLTSTWPYLAYNEVVVGGGKQETVTDILGRQARFTSDSSKRITGIKRPSEAGDGTTVAYDTNNRVTSITRIELPVRNYTWTAGTNQLTSVSNDALERKRTVVASTTGLAILSDKNAYNQTVTYAYDTNGRLLSVTQPEGNKVQYTYDTRGNVTEVRRKDKAGTAANDIVTLASFDASCANAKICNKPLWTKDALGNQTDYTYDGAHGGVLTVTSPAATAGGTRPQVRNTYANVQARYLTAPGTWSTSGNIVRLSQSSTCRSGNAGAGCLGTANETISQVVYPAGTTPNNAQPISSTVKAGDNSISSTTAVAYGALGEVQTVDGPLPGTADTTRYRYDAVLQLTGVVAPDPDGAGSRLPMALRTSYNDDGQATLQEAGTVADQSDAAWQAFASEQQVATDYDTAGRPIKVVQSSGVVTTSVTQQSYDDFGRPDCSVVRMDPAQWAGQTDACVPQTTDPNNVDRVTRTEYDLLNRLISITEGVDTTQETVSGTLIYELGENKNAQLVGVKDGENNLTTYEYDNHDRLLKTRYPDTAKGAPSSSTSDYEQLTYDNASRVSLRRLRDGNQIAFAYDNLNRVTYVDRPVGEADNSITYDLLGNPTLVQDSAGGFVGYAWDALGRQTAESSPLGVFGKGYDVAGRLTQLVWPDNFFVNYVYDTIGNVIEVRENGATTGAGLLAQYSYDNLGRRTGIVRGNGTSSGIGYDTPGRLQNIGHTFPLATSNVTWTYSYNAAGQLNQTSRNNDAYAWNGHFDAERTYTANGRNQYSQIAPAGQTLDTPSYDLRGNITATNGVSYTYNSLNQLTAVSSSAPLSYNGTLSYDPAGRLAKLISGETTLQIMYAGSLLLGEKDAAGTMLARYVHGPGSDEPIVAYEGVGVSTRKWLHADERGSIVALSDVDGVVTKINAYDEYGLGTGANQGRFRYTGQAVFDQIGLAYYKARFYSPGLGRFLQTDPIGYGDGLNWYNYVGSDPVNYTDPTGTRECTINEIIDMIFTGEYDPGEQDGLPICTGGGGGSTWYLVPDRGIREPTIREPREPRERPQSGPCSAPLDTGVGSARAVLETVATGLDIATVGLAAGGVTGPLAIGTKALGYLAEAGLGAVNGYDAYANGNWQPLAAQGASLGARLIPGGRTLQSGLKTARGPTGLLRNSAGQFRSSRLNNPAIKEAGDLATQKAAGGAVEGVVCRP